MSEISSKQLAANRENSKKGGVRTTEGKEISKYNALRHGLLSKEVLLQSESAEDLALLTQKLHMELSPESALEHVLADRIVTNIWRLRRMIRVEREVMESTPYGMPKPTGGALGANFAQSHVYDRIMRYEANIERGIYRAWHELQRLQAMRRGDAVLAPIAVDVDISGGKNGFVS